MDVAGQRVVVVGLARSGVAAARLLARRGARVVATDRKPAHELPEEVVSLGSVAQLALGSHGQAGLDAADLVVVSPGVPWQLPELQAARAKGIPVLAEIELGFRMLEGSVVAVTGTKGKSTTTAALGTMLRAGGGDVRVAGNIGDPLTAALEGAGAQTVFVLEVSSFQLEGTQLFHPRVAVFLNLSADHLDRHPSLQAYAAAKERVFANQTAADFAVVNADDPRVLELARRNRARIVSFSAQRDPGGPDAAFFDEGFAVVRLLGHAERVFAAATLQVPGPHLAADLLAAAAGARLLGATPGEIARAAASFQGAEHVLERVGETAGVVYYDDSKATNVAAAHASLLAMQRPTHAIMGGRYKGGDFRELRETARKTVKQVLVIGEAQQLIADAMAGVVPVTRCVSLREAVERAAGAAAAGDAILLAPGCSSFDMFPDYAARGRAFKDEVARLVSTRSTHG